MAVIAVPTIKELFVEQAASGGRNQSVAVGIALSVLALFVVITILRSLCSAAAQQVRRDVGNGQVRQGPRQGHVRQGAHQDHTSRPVVESNEDTYDGHERYELSQLPHNIRPRGNSSHETLPVYDQTKIPPYSSKTDDVDRASTPSVRPREGLDAIADGSLDQRDGSIAVPQVVVRLEANQVEEADITSAFHETRQ